MISLVGSFFYLMSTGLLVESVGFATPRIQESLKENIEGFVRESICLFEEFSLDDGVNMERSIVVCKLLM